MRDPIPFDTGNERKGSKSIRCKKVRVVEEGNSKGNDGTDTIKLQSHKKSRGG